MNVISRFPREAGEHPDCPSCRSPFFPLLCTRVGLTFGAHDRPKSAAKLSGQQLPVKATSSGRRSPGRVPTWRRTIQCLYHAEAASIREGAGVGKTRLPTHLHSPTLQSWSEILNAICRLYKHHRLSYQLLTRTKLHGYFSVRRGVRPNLRL